MPQAPVVSPGWQLPLTSQQPCAHEVVLQEPAPVDGQLTPGLHAQTLPDFASPALQLVPPHGVSFSPPHTPLHAPETQVWSAPQAKQPFPPVPQAPVTLPGSQLPLRSQQPLAQEVVLQEPAPVDGQLTPGLHAQTLPDFASPALHVLPAQGGSFSPPQAALQEPETHARSAPQALQAPTFLPQAPVPVPSWQLSLPSQQPCAHEVVLQEPAPVEGQVAAELQTQSDPFDVKPRLQLPPAQGGWSRPPQVALPQAWPVQRASAPQVAHPAPPLPQAPFVSPGSQFPLASQQPLGHELAEHEPPPVDGQAAPPLHAQLLPETVSPGLQLPPAQGGWPRPPQVGPVHAWEAEQLWSAPQAVQVAALLPQAPLVFPGSQSPLESQQPSGQEFELQDPPLVDGQLAPLLQAQMLPETTRPGPQLVDAQVGSFSPPQSLHWPLSHCCPAVHWIPQLPQFLSSFAKSTQREPHWFSPERQVTAQAPDPLQISPLGQRWPQLPQLFRSMLVLAQ